MLETFFERSETRKLMSKITTEINKTYQTSYKKPTVFHKMETSE